MQRSGEEASVQRSGEEALVQRSGEEASVQASGEQAPLERLYTVFERYQQTLAQMRRSDRELRATRALDQLRRKPASWGPVPVLLYGFDDFTELQVDTILTLGGVVGAPVMVSLAYEPGRVAFLGRASTFQRLVPFAETHTELRARADHYAPSAREALHHLERSLLSDDPQQVESGEAVRLLEGGNPRAELELLAGEVRALLDGGVAAQEIAIVHRSPESIAGLLGEVLEDFDIPYAQRRHTMFADTALGRGLLGMLRCATEVGELGDLLAWLGAPGVLEHPQLLDRFELRARRQGVLDSARARALWEAENWPLERIDRVREAADSRHPGLARRACGRAPAPVLRPPRQHRGGARARTSATRPAHLWAHAARSRSCASWHARRPSLRQARASWSSYWSGSS